MKGLTGLASIVMVTSAYADGTLEDYLKDGEEFLKQGRFDRAIEQFKLAVKKDENCGEAYYRLGLAHRMKGELEKAKENYEKAIEIDPENHLSHFQLGEVLLRLGKKEESIAKVKKSVELNPGFCQGHYILAHDYVRKGKLDKSIEHLEKGANVTPNTKADQKYYKLCLYSLFDMYVQGKREFYKGISVLQRIVEKGFEVKSPKHPLEIMNEVYKLAIEHGQCEDDEESFRRDALWLEKIGNHFYDKWKQTKKDKDLKHALVRLGQASGLTGDNKVRNRIWDGVGRLFSSKEEWRKYGVQPNLESYLSSIRFK